MIFSKFRWEEKPQISEPYKSTGLTLTVWLITDYYMGISILAWLLSRDAVEGQYVSRDDNQANMEII